MFNNWAYDDITFFTQYDSHNSIVSFSYPNVPHAAYSQSLSFQFGWVCVCLNTTGNCAIPTCGHASYFIP
jgi:hypothetical protein